MLDSSKPEALLDSALAAVEDETSFRAKLDKIGVPIYMAGTDGRITFWNQACVDFAGREPQLGEDRWCVTWRLFTLDGDPLPHDQCPMAKAIREQRSIRSEVAIAMRPNGSRVAFRPYPTPLFDESGRFKGAINILIDISDEQAEALKEQAARCRRLANSTDDLSARDILRSMATGYDESADSLRG
ncbi:MAG TPA: PAS domain-containing protein [Sphingomicrobium sp.]|nr:PAS domain-containing protein [Sphingomicrobium sp.]